MSGCIEKKHSNEVTEENNILTMNIDKLPKDLGFLDVKDTRNLDILCFLFDGLVDADSNGKITGALAESYDVSKDGLTYTFKLRKNIKWSNEKQIVASDFVDFFKVILSNKMAFVDVNELYPIFGAEGFNKGKNTFKDVAINALDNYTLQIRMNYPKEDFLRILSKPSYRLRRNFEKLNNYTNQFKDIEYSGAFKVIDVSDKKIMLGKSEAYWDKAKEDKILLAVDSKEKAIASFNGNKVNVIFDVPIKQAGEIATNGNLEFYPTWDAYGVIFNNNKDSIASNIKFKRVIEDSIKLSYSNDKYLASGGMIESRGQLVFNSSMQDAKATFNKSAEPLDISKLNTFLKDIDFDKETMVLNILALNETKSKLMIEALNKVLATDLNIKTNVKFINLEDYDKVLKEGNFNIALVNIKRVGNKDEFYSRWTKDNKLNYGKYENETYDKLFIKPCKDAKEKEELFVNLQSILKRDMPYIPFYYDSINYIYSSNIKGLELDGNNNIVLKRLYKEMK